MLKSVILDLTKLQQAKPLLCLYFFLFFYQYFYRLFEKSATLINCFCNRKRKITNLTNTEQNISFLKSTVKLREDQPQNKSCWTLVVRIGCKVHKRLERRLGTHLNSHSASNGNKWFLARMESFFLASQGSLDAQLTVPRIEAKSGGNKSES